FRRQIVTLDFRTSKRSERVFDAHDPDVRDVFRPLQEGVMLGSRIADPYHTETLALVKLPDYREVTEVAFATKPRKPRPIVSGIQLSTEFDFAVSDDRKRVAYSFDNVIVCRRTDPLDILWTRTVERGLSARRLALSARGDFLAVGASDNGLAVLE